MSITEGEVKDGDRVEVQKDGFSCFVPVIRFCCFNHWFGYGYRFEAGEEGDYLPIATPSPLEMTPALRWAAMEVSWLVGALSPVNHKGLYQGEQQMEDILMFH